MVTLVWEIMGADRRMLQRPRWMSLWSILGDDKRYGFSVEMSDKELQLAIAKARITVLEDGFERIGRG